MEKKAWRFIIPVLSFKICILAFVLSLVTLLTGITGNSPNSPPILTFNVSSLGLQNYHNPNSVFHTNITTLVPSDITNPPSITQYLGARDWYSLHYFSNCSGFYAPSTSNPAILTATRTNITCNRQTSGYIFKLHDVIQSQLSPAVSGLAHDVSTAQYSTGTMISLWYSGISNCAITAYTLPWSFFGTRPWLNSWLVWDAFLTTVLLMASSAIVTNTIITVQHASGLPGPNPGSAGFLALMWTTTALMAVVLGLMVVQYNLEGRPSHRRNKCCQRRREVVAEDDGIPLNDQKSERTLVGVQDLKRVD